MHSRRSAAYTCMFYMGSFHLFRKVSSGPHCVSSTVLGFRDKRDIYIYPLPYAFDILRFKVN